MPASADCRHAAGVMRPLEGAAVSGPGAARHHRAGQVEKAGGEAVGAASGVQGDGLAAQGTQRTPTGVDLHIAFPAGPGV